MAAYRSTGPDSWARARRAFYDTGDVPPQLLAEPLRKSWMRSARMGIDSRRGVEFDPVPRGRVDELRDRNQRLLDASRATIGSLLRTVANAPWLILVVDPEGMVVEGFNDSSKLGRELRLIARTGVDLSEPRIGTNGPGTALAEEAPVLVEGNQHFVETTGVYTCAAAPIRDPFGKLAGCLDLSTLWAGEACRFDPLRLVTAYAGLVEDRLFSMLPAGHLVVRLACDGGLFAPGRQAALAVDTGGRIVAANPCAADLFGLSPAELTQREAGELFDLPAWEHLSALAADPKQPAPIGLCNGLTVLARVERTGTEGGDACGPAAPDVRRKLAPSARATDRHDPLRRLAEDTPALTPALDRARAAYRHGIPVLLQGETGTGKEVVARALHDSGPRHNGPWVAINCAAIPETLIESELFGYMDGAFTGARKGGAAGKIELAHRGTLFLDEIGDMPLALQSRLLRVLEEREVTRVGGLQAMAVDIALIAATHQNLPRLIREGRFRLDLYYRINGLACTLPPLRDRPGFAATVRRLLAQNAPNRPLPRISAAAMELLAHHSWPGNLRELVSVLRTAQVLAGEDEIGPEHLPPELAPAGGAAGRCAAGSMEALELAAVRHAIEAHGGNISAAARSLRVSRTRLYRMLRSHEDA